MQLGTLLGQFLSPEQFVKNAQVKENSQERVEFAVKLPGYDMTSGDYRHVLPVSTLRIVNKLSVCVSGDLRTSIDRAIRPITPAIKRREEILKLLDPTLSAEQFGEAVNWQERMDAQSFNLVSFVKNKIIPRLAPKEFEELVKALLESLESLKILR